MSSALHPDGKTNSRLTSSNESGNPSIQELIDTRKLSRRTFLQSSFGAIALTVSDSFRFDGLGHAHAAPMEYISSHSPIVLATRADYWWPAMSIATLPW
jgi:secreted PhoX family phosphatase